MKKKVFALLLTVVLCALLGVSAFAADTDRLNDMAGLLTEQQQQDILSRLDEVSQRLQMDLVIVTTDTLGGKTAEAYADDYFDYNGFGFGENWDGALLLISMEPDNRRCHISTSGSGIYYFNDALIDRMLDVIVDEHLAYGEFYEGMGAFPALCELYVGGETDSEFLPEQTPPSLLSQLPRWLGIALIAGLVVAAARVGIMKSSMKTVRSQPAANNYLVGGVNVNRASDLYLYHTVTRHKKESSSGSSTHQSSSGRSHGGGGRSF